MVALRIRFARHCKHAASTWALLLGVLCTSAHVHAQDGFEALTPAEQDAFLGHLATGNDAYEAGRYEDAVAAYEAALAITEFAEIHYRLALVFDKLVRDEAAIAAYERFLELEPHSKDRGRVETELVRLRERLEASRRATLELFSVPPGAQVRLDDAAGEVLGTTPVELAWPAGALTVYVELAGHEPATRTLELDGGARTRLDLTLVPLPADVPDEPVPVEPPEDDGVGLLVGGAVSLGVAGLAGIAAGVLYVETTEAIDLANDYYNERGAGDSWEVLADKQDEARALETAFWVTTGVAGAALVVGSVLLVVDAVDDDEPAPALEVGAMLQPGGGHATLRVRY